MRCPYCQSSIADDIKRCSICGQLLVGTPNLSAGIYAVGKFPKSSLKKEGAQTTSSGRLLTTCASCQTDIEVTPHTTICPVCGDDILGDDASASHNANAAAPPTGPATKGNLASNGHKAGTAPTQASTIHVVLKPQLREMPGFMEGEIIQIDPLAGEVRDVDPLQALVVAIGVIEAFGILFAVYWPLPLALISLVALAYFIPPPSEVGGGCLAELLWRPFEPVRRVCDIALQAFDPRRAGQTKIPCYTYVLKSSQGPQTQFAVLGNLRPSNPTVGSQIKAWTVPRNGRVYFRQGTLIHVDTQENVELRLPPPLIGRYYLLAYLLLHVIALSLLWWL